LFDLRLGIFGGVQQNSIRDLFSTFTVSGAGCCSEDPNCEAGVTSSRISDAIELVVGDDILLKPPLRSRTQNVIELLVMVLVHPDVLAGAQPAYKAIVNAAEQLFFLVRDADNRELWETVEVVDDTRVFQLIDLIEDNDGSRAVVPLESVNEFVMRC
jgi:hypothetical protein